MRGRPSLATLSTLTKIRAAAKGAGAFSIFPSGFARLDPRGPACGFGRAGHRQSAGHFSAGAAETESTGIATSMRFFVNARAAIQLPTLIQFLKMQKLLQSRAPRSGHKVRKLLREILHQVAVPQMLGEHLIGEGNLSVDLRRRQVRRVRVLKHIAERIGKRVGLLLMRLIDALKKAI